MPAKPSASVGKPRVVGMHRLESVHQRHRVASTHFDQDVDVAGAVSDTVDLARESR